MKNNLKTAKRIISSLKSHYKNDVQDITLLGCTIKFTIAEKRMNNISSNIGEGWNSIRVFRGLPETPRGVKRWRPASITIGEPHSYPMR